jgi:DNA-binding transcriptional LysR family regulator
MDLNEIVVFAKVVETGSFVGASRELDMPKSTVSRKVSELEERLGARLLQRTTRKLSLTDVGRAFHRHASRVVAEAEEAELVVSRMQEVPRGLLRVTVPLSFGHYAPMAASFLKRYPEVELEMVCTDRVVDLIQDGFDIAIRAGQLADSSLVARSLGALESYLVASPSFLKKNGRPTDPSELERVDCIVFGAGADRASWKLSRKGKTLSVKVRARFTVNDFDFLGEAVLGGLGVAMIPVDRCIDQLRTKRLERLLTEWSPPKIPLHAVYPSTRHLSPKVKAFVDHLREQLSPPPWQLGPVPT